jgi:hypothetical protein
MAEDGRGTGEGQGARQCGRTIRREKGRRSLKGAVGLAVEGEFSEGLEEEEEKGQEQ